MVPQLGANFYACSALITKISAWHRESSLDQLMLHLGAVLPFEFSVWIPRRNPAWITCAPAWSNRNYLE